MRKKTKTFLSLTLVLVVAAACSRENRRSRQFEVVEEGSAHGVSSAIAGPGEMTPPLTDTNADTTTAFATIPTPPNVDPTLTSTDGSLADSLPATTGSGVWGSRFPGTTQPRPQRPPGTIEVTIPPRTDTAQQPPSTEPAPPPAEAPPATTAPPPTTTAPPPPPPAEEKKEKEEEEAEEDDEEPPAPPVRLR